ncbi:hypothetical protein HMPREF9080_00262 [Cardiobacterium valvarum F0432]|uniref:Uncharacterized protein n=1 Tax=Cardiobacterium valvarum F0432 TaxID=797473 RepID=G9ZBY5_9GAMM|nr:hypothetical protein HMPREF9080_00262 [Cardiobacterium valvarum F0432]
MAGTSPLPVVQNLYLRRLKGPATTLFSTKNPFPRLRGKVPLSDGRGKPSVYTAWRA